MACFSPGGQRSRRVRQTADWTQNNGGRRSETTFAGLAVGQKDDEQWTLLDSNSASDSDLWIAGRCWRRAACGNSRSTPRPEKALLARIVAEETVAVPGLGTMLLPGKVGFADDSGWRFNPSYLPPQLATYFVRFGAPRCAT